MSRRARWRRFEDRAARWVITACGFFGVVVLVGIFGLLVSESLAALGGGLDSVPVTPEEARALGPKVSAALKDAQHAPPVPLDFVDTLWRPDALGEAHYGVLAMVISTLITTLGALAIAVPLGFAVAAWLAFSAGGRIQHAVKTSIELLAAIPSVVVGFVGLQLTGPFIGWVSGTPGGLNALNGAVLLAIMALPTVISLSEDALSAVPRAWLDASLALGADRWQTVVHVAFPAARSGLFAAVMLGMGRTIGETMTVLMATGNAPAMPGSLFDPVRTLTATIAIELGEVANGTTHYHALFVVGTLLFLITLAVNLAAEWVQARQARMFG